VSVDLSFRRYDGPGTTHVIYVLYLDDATFIFHMMNQLTSELLLTEIERVLRSNDQFVLDHCVQRNITHVSFPKGGTGKRCDYVDTERFLKDKRCIIQIQNKDDMCCARAIVTAKAKIDEHEQWNSIRQSRRIQEELALELHVKAGVPLHQCESKM
jgi:hypothetical protein